jgi:predicted O-methyltransferase YrrM
VDVNPKAIQTTREALSVFPNATVRQMDGIQYLRERAQAPYSSIDLLFLDAWDVDISDCAEQHVRAYEAARPKLHEKSIVLIDDTDVNIVDGKLQPVDFPGGKGRLLVPRMESEGWRVYSGGRCALMIRR